MGRHRTGVSRPYVTAHSAPTGRLPPPPPPPLPLLLPPLLLLLLLMLKSDERGTAAFGVGGPLGLGSPFCSCSSRCNGVVLPRRVGGSRRPAGWSVHCTGQRAGGAPLLVCAAETPVRGWAIRLPTTGPATGDRHPATPRHRRRHRQPASVEWVGFVCREGERQAGAVLPSGRLLPGTARHDWAGRTSPRHVPPDMSRGAVQQHLLIVICWEMRS